MRRLLGLMTIWAGLTLVVPMERAFAQLPIGCVRQSTEEDDDHATERCRIESLYGKEVADQMIHLRNGPRSPSTYNIDGESEPKPEGPRQKRPAVRPPGLSTRPSTSASATATIPAPPRSPRLIRVSPTGAAIVAFAEEGSIATSGEALPQAARIWSLVVYRNGTNFLGKPAAGYWQLYEFECGEQIANLRALVAIDGQSKIVGATAQNARAQVRNGTPLSGIWSLACGMAQFSTARLTSTQAAIADSGPPISAQPSGKLFAKPSTPTSSWSPYPEKCKLDAAMCAAISNDAQTALDKILNGE